jgi:hypothetical protein
MMASPVTPWNTHKCSARSCRREVDASRAFCPGHWQQLPDEMKAACAGNSSAAESGIAAAVEFLGTTK